MTVGSAGCTSLNYKIPDPSTVALTSGVTVSGSGVCGDIIYYSIEGA